LTLNIKQPENSNLIYKNGTRTMESLSKGAHQLGGGGKRSYR
jgi:hypothetical protein